MAPFALNLETAHVETTQVELEPALNGFTSALLIAKETRDPGLHEWIERSRTQMSTDEFTRHKLVLIGFFYAASPRGRAPSFPAYLTDLEKTSPSVFRQTLLDSYAKIYKGNCTPEERAAPVDWEETLTSRTNYISFLKARFGENHLESEWTRVRPLLEESVRAFKKVDFREMSRVDAARFITGQELGDSKWEE